MKCPNCKAKITTKNYDPDYEIYECPKCSEAFTADDLEEAETGTSPRKRADAGRPLAHPEGEDERWAEIITGKPTAKGKKRQTEIAADDEAIAKFEAEQMKPKKKADAEVKHRDEIETSQLLEIVADEVETIWDEFGADINRLNAREFFAMNIIRPLRINGVHFRDKEVRAVYCKEHK